MDVAKRLDVVNPGDSLHTVTTVCKVDRRAFRTAERDGGSDE